MVLIRPVTRTKISTDTFGHPVYDALIRQGISMQGTSASFPTGAYTNVPWNTVLVDTGGFRTSSLVTTIPVGKGGIYAITYAINGSVQNTGSYLSTYVGTVRYDINGNNSGMFLGSITVPISEGTTVTFKLWNGSGVPFTPYGDATLTRCDIYRVGI